MHAKQCVLRTSAPPLRDLVPAGGMDGALDTARQFLAGRLDAAMGVASAVQARLVAAGLLSPSSNVRLALVLAGLAAFMLARLLLLRFLASLFFPVRVPRLRVPLTPLEQDLHPPGGTWDPSQGLPKDYVPCYDPGSLALLGTGRAPVDSPATVHAKVAAAADAQKAWAGSSFAQRRRLLRILQRFILDNQADICAVAARDSGKPMVDAAFGEVMVTLEKIDWLCAHGEACLRPERRVAGRMMFYKRCRVEYVPVGVMGAIVPWNYPFHNVFNPLLANLFAGNALVVKVSEYASWSASYYGRVISAALDAAGAPAGLVQILTGYGETGNALVTCPQVAKVVFVGSPAIGRRVMASAAAHLKPVVLELGGKDAFVVCDDADLSQVVPIALRGAFQSCGQNCAGAERFFVQTRLYGPFCDAVAKATGSMTVGWALDPDTAVDAGAMCMPQQGKYVQGLVDDAVSKGAKVLARAQVLPGASGQFFAPLVLAGVTPAMRIATEEVFGPVLCVSVFDTDDDAVRLANACPFGLGSSVFSRSPGRARALGARLEAGMTSINDFATTYMAQSLPFGGVKESGFDRFAGIEGLRGCCHVKAVAEDAVPWLIRTDIPPPLRYPVAPYAFDFVSGLIKMFYGLTWGDCLAGLYEVAAAFLKPARRGKAKAKAA